MVSQIHSQEPMETVTFRVPSSLAGRGSAEWAELVLPARNVEQYAHLVLDKSRGRQVRAAAVCASAATSDPSVSTDGVLRMIQESLLQIEARSRKSTGRHIKEVIPEMLRELELPANNQGLLGMSKGLHSLHVARRYQAWGSWTIGAPPGRGELPRTLLDRETKL
jgi:replicative DNA helicase